MYGLKIINKLTVKNSDTQDLRLKKQNYKNSKNNREIL